MRLSSALEVFYMSMYGVVSDSTIKFYEGRLPSLIKILGDKEISEVTLDDLRYWRTTLSKRDVKYQNHKYHPEVKGKLSPYTIRQYVRCAKRFFKWLYEDEKLDHNPAQRLKMPPKPDLARKGISKVNLAKIIAAAEKSCVRDLAIVLFLADTGCRVGGLTHLKIENIDLNNNRAIVFEKGKGGSAKKRTVFFGDRTAFALSSTIVQRPQDDEIHPDSLEFLFLGSRKSRGAYKKLSEAGIYQILKRLAKGCGIEKGFNPHNFRHGAIRGWLNNGMPLSLASQLAGHSSVNVTGDIYGTANERELSSAHEMYTWLD
jgi:integrase/recombinase XerD